MLSIRLTPNITKFIVIQVSNPAQQHGSELFQDTENHETRNSKVKKYERGNEYYKFICLVFLN